MHVHASPNRGTNKLTCQEVDQAVAGYTSKAVDPDRWAEIVDDLTVVACDAGFEKLLYLRRALTSVSSFASSCSRSFTEPWTLAALLTDFNIERYAALGVQNGLTPNTVRNHRSDVNRLRRAMRGLPRLGRSGSVTRPEPAGVRTLSPAETMTLTVGCSPATRGAIAVAVGTGLRPIDLDSGPVLLEVGDESVWARRCEESFEIPAEVADHIRDCAGESIDRDTWEMARQEISELGVVFDANDLRQIWVNGLAGKSIPMRDLVIGHGLSYRALDASVAGSKFS